MVTAAAITSGLGSTSISGNQVLYDTGSDYDYLAAGETATVVINYTISDGNGGTDSADLTITVTGSNDGPIAVADTDATLQGTPVTTDVVANDTDTDATDVLTITTGSVAISSATLDSDSSAISLATASVSTSGDEVTFDPATDFDFLAVGETATVVIDYSIEDGEGGTDNGTLTITVTGTNDGPVAAADIDTTTENTSVTTDVIANDTDTDSSDTLSLQGGTAILNSATLDSDSSAITITDATVTQSGNNITFNPGSDFNFLADGETATVVIDYVVIDDNGGSDNSTLTITVTGTNDGPVAVADTDATTENASVTTDVIANDTDVDATDTLTLQTGSAILNSATLDSDSSSITITDATVTQSGNNVTFNPGSDFNFLAAGETATVVIDYVVIDGNGGSDNSTLTITVTGTNDGPIAVADLGGTNEGTSATFDVLANDTDPDASDSLSITSALITTGSGSVSIVSDEIVYDPGTSYDSLADGETATVIVDYTISDGNGGTDNSTLTITVTGTNDGPVAVADTDATDEEHYRHDRCDRQRHRCRRDGYAHVTNGQRDSELGHARFGQFRNHDHRRDRDAER